MEYTLIRSKRKTVSLQLKPDGTLVVRAPLKLGKAEIDRFVAGNEQWVQQRRKGLQEAMRRNNGYSRLTAAELDTLTKRAKAYIPQRVAYYAEKLGVDYGRITIRHQKTRWGSCSSKGNLNFNCLLMLAPPEVIDSVVVHELCHRREMNHSARFYAEVRRVFPAYDRHHRWLKENGKALLNRLP